MLIERQEILNDLRNQMKIDEVNIGKNMNSIACD